jgi:hypothetical protein
LQIPFHRVEASCSLWLLAGWILEAQTFNFEASATLDHDYAVITHSVPVGNDAGIKLSF